MTYGHDASGDTMHEYAGLRHQCAWCRRIVDSSGSYRMKSDRIISPASYGICPTCKARLLAAADAVFSVGASANSSTNRGH
jgi:hypothetical protein